MGTTGRGVPVECGFTVYKVSAIDGIAQTFYCDFKIFAQWVDPALIGHDASVKVDWKKAFSPNIYVKNAIELETTEDRLRLRDPKRGLVTHTRRFRGTLSQFYRLHDFPFDTQTLTIHLSSTGHIDKNYFIQHRSRNNVIERFELQEWEVLPLAGPSIELTDPSLSSTGVAYSEYLAQIRLQRFSSYYVFNVGAVMALLVSMCFYTSAIPLVLLALLFSPLLLTSFCLFVICLLILVLFSLFLLLSSLSLLLFFSFSSPLCLYSKQTKDALPDRMSITLTLILTVVAFKYSVSDNLPKINYMTLLDKYVLVSFLFLYAMGLENFLISTSSSEKEVVEAWDHRLMVWWLCLWVVFHLYCMVVVLFKRRRKLQQHSKVVEAKEDEVGKGSASSSTTEENANSKEKMKQS
ncbi:hypothetical protein QOT17_007669 [Balamuthia mandrillaris]